MKLPLTSKRLESEARSHLLGDLDDYDPEIRRAARNTLLVLAVMLAATVFAGMQSCHAIESPGSVAVMR